MKKKKKKVCIWFHHIYRGPNSNRHSGHQVSNGKIQDSEAIPEDGRSERKVPVRNSQLHQEGTECEGERKLSQCGHSNIIPFLNSGYQGRLWVPSTLFIFDSNGSFMKITDSHLAKADKTDISTNCFKTNLKLE